MKQKNENDDTDCSSNSGSNLLDMMDYKGSKKQAWTKHEDMNLLKIVEKYGAINWDILAKNLPNRTGKQCRERYQNILDPKLRKGNWTPEEDSRILALHEMLGNQWAKISRALVGRTDNSVKNRWHALTKSRKTPKKAPNDMEVLYNLCLMREKQKMATNEFFFNSGCAPL